MPQYITPGSVLPAGGGGSPAHYMVGATSGGTVEGGDAWAPLTDAALIQDGGAVTLGVTSGMPSVVGAGVALQSRLVLDPAFVVAHPDLGIYAETVTSNAAATQFLYAGLDANIGVDPVTGVPLWANAVWDVFNQTGADLSQANAILPNVVSAAGGSFFFLVTYQAIWTPA